MDPVQFVARLWDAGRGRPQDILPLIFGLAMIILIMALLAFINRYRTAIVRQKDFFIQSLRLRGLHAEQIDLINEMVAILELKEPYTLMEDTYYFTKALRKLSLRRKDIDLNGKAMDILHTYARIYHPESHKKPLSSLQDLEVTHLVLAVSEQIPEKTIAVIESNTGEALVIRLLTFTLERTHVPPETPVALTVLRPGEGVIEFSGKIIIQDHETLTVAIPADYVVTQKAVHALVDVIIDASVSFPSQNTESGFESIPCLILKMNEVETLLRVETKLDFTHTYSIVFTVLDFTIECPVNLLTGKYIASNKSYYYSARFGEMSANASLVLDRYLTTMV